MTRTADASAALFVFAACVVSVALQARLPLYRVFISWLLPVTAAAVYLIVRNVGRRSAAPRHQETVVAIGLNASMFIVSLHVLMVSNVAGVAWARALGPRAVIVLFGMACIAAGNLLPRTHANLAVGIRTRKTLADPQLWSRMHRLGGYVVVAFGVVLIAAGTLLRGRAIVAAINVAAIVAALTLVTAYRRSRHD